MAPKKVSALSAALSGAPVAAPPPPASSTGASRSLAVFPCLACAPDDGSDLPDLSELADGLDGLAVKGYTVVGSAPTRTSLPNGTPLVRGRRRKGFRRRGGACGHRLARSRAASARPACDPAAPSPSLLPRAGRLPAGPLPPARRQGGRAFRVIDRAPPGGAALRAPPRAARRLPRLRPAPPPPPRAPRRARRRRRGPDAAAPADRPQSMRAPPARPSHPLPTPLPSPRTSSARCPASRRAASPPTMAPSSAACPRA
jgi:hypothetical protein